MDKRQIFFVTLIFPIVGLFYSFRNWTNRNAKNIFWLFCSFLGMIQIFHPEGTILGKGADGGRYALKLIEMHNNSWSISNVFESLYKEGTLDIYQPLITYLVSIFTDNAHCLFFVFAVVFGFFYSRNIWYLLDRLPDKLPKLIWILIFYYILVCPIWNINGVRMWTALHIFVYGAMPFILEKNVKKIIWCFLSIFVHFSFIIPLLILILYKLLYIRHIVNIAYLFIIYIISLSIKSINLDFLRNILSNISLLDNKNAYLSNEYIELVKNRQYAWHVILANDISYWIIQIMIFYSFYLYCKEKNRWSDSLKRLFSFSLVLYSISNIISLIPSLGRFLSLSKMFMIPLIIFVLVNFMSSSRQKIMLLFLPLIFSIIFQIRTGLDYYGIMLLLGNFFTAPFIIFDVPLIQFFK